MSDSLHSMDCRMPGSSVHGILRARILEWIIISSLRGSSNLVMKLAYPASPALTDRFFTTEPPGKPMNPYVLISKTLQEISLTKIQVENKVHSLKFSVKTLLGLNIYILYMYIYI